MQNSVEGCKIHIVIFNIYHLQSSVQITHAMFVIRANVSGSEVWNIAAENQHETVTAGLCRPWPTHLDNWNRAGKGQSYIVNSL